MIKSFIRFGVLVLALALLGLPAAGSTAAATNRLPGDFIGDQSFAVGGESGWQVNYLWNTRQLARVGQEFTPTIPALNVVNLAPFTCEACSPQWLMVRIRKNSIQGWIVGISYPVRLDAANNEAHTQFRFPFLVHLKPGDRYVIEVVPLLGHENSILWYGEPGVDFYTGGNAIARSRTVNNADLWFEEGMLVSSPRIAFDCVDGGWHYLLRSDGSAFANQNECVRYNRTGH